MSFKQRHPRFVKCCKVNLICCGILIAAVIVAGFIIPPTKQDTNELKRNNWIVYYDKKVGNLIQICAHDGITEHLLVNDPAYNYWWVKFDANQTKFLTYRTPLGSGLNNYWVADLMSFTFNGVNGTDGKVLLRPGDYGWEMNGVAKWSPDGELILLAAFCTDPASGDGAERWRLAIVDKNGQNPKIISTNPWDHADPSWSPDGTKIVYVSYPDASKAGDNNNFEIYVADLNRSSWKIENPKRLSTDNDYCFDPAWSPDGEWIAYSRGKYLLTPWKIDLYKVKVDGTSETILVQDARTNGVPYWSPDGTRVYFHTVGLYQKFSIASCDGITGGDKSLIIYADPGEYSTPSVFYKL